MQKYDVICEKSLDSLVISVNAKLKDGWKISGDVKILRIPGVSISYMQPVVLDEK